MKVARKLTRNGCIKEVFYDGDREGAIISQNQKSYFDAQDKRQIGNEVIRATMNPIDNER